MVESQKDAISLGGKARFSPAHVAHKQQCGFFTRRVFPRVAGERVSNLPWRASFKPALEELRFLAVRGAGSRRGDRAGDRPHGGERRRCRPDHHGWDRRLGPDDRTPGAANHDDRGSRWPGGRTPAALTDAESDDAPAPTTGAGISRIRVPSSNPGNRAVWWALRDSNPRPSPCKGETNLQVRASWGSDRGPLRRLSTR